MFAAIFRFEEAASRSAGTERPRLATEIPHRGEQGPGRLRIHREHAATRGEIGAGEHLAPALAAIIRLIHAAFGAIVPQVAGHAGVDCIAIRGIDQDFGDALGILQPHIGEVLAAIGRFINAVAHGNAVARPTLSRARPDILWIGRVDRNRAHGLRRRVIEYGMKVGSRVDRFPDAAAGRCREYREPPFDLCRCHRSHASAHRRRPDVARRQARDSARIEAHRRLRGQHRRQRQSQ